MNIPTWICGYERCAHSSNSSHHGAYANDGVPNTGWVHFSSVNVNDCECTCDETFAREKWDH